MRVGDDILALPSDATSAWLSSVLGTPVEIHSVEPLGEGGRVSTIARITISGIDCPSTLIIKCAPGDPAYRARVHQMGYLKAEAYFYRDIAETCGIPVPRCWHAAFDEDSGCTTLVLDDFAPRLPGSARQRLTRDHAAIAMPLIAQLHARHWGATGPWPWLDELATARAELQSQSMIDHVPDVIRRYADRLPRSVVDCLPQVGEHVVAALRRARDRGEITLSHGDFRTMNIAFGRDAADVVVFDWQFATAATPAIDLVKLIGDLSTEDRRAFGDDLLALYHSVITDCGAPVSMDDIRGFFHDGISARLIEVVLVLGRAAPPSLERGILELAARLGDALDDGW